MQVLFKYYNELDINYFNDPTIKLSCITKLNDPFEKIIEKNLRQIAIGHNKKSNLKGFFDGMQFNLLMERVGIVSLTETPRNLLMWSHYANQHKGICIGYKTSFLDKHKNRTHETLPVYYHPVKVNYDNCRYSEHTDSLPNLNSTELKKEIIIKSLTTKGNDWMYEKEHRSIIPLEHCDHIFCKGDKLSKDYLKTINLIEVINDKEFKFKQPTAIDILDSAKDDNLIFRLNIDHEEIASIFFGCESDHENNCMLVRKIKEIPRLSHVKIYQAVASRTNFELDIVPFVDDLDYYLS